MKNRRILSVIFAVLICVQVTFAGGLSVSAEDGPVLTYNFIGTASSETNVGNMTFDALGGNWQWYGVTPGGTTEGYVTRGLMTLRSSRFDITVYTNEWAALELKVTKAGRYSVDFTKVKYNIENSGKAEIYIIPKTELSEVGSKLTASSCLGTVDFKTGDVTDGSGVTETLSDANIKDAGNYLLVFKNVASGCVRFKQLKLKWAGEYEQQIAEKYNLVSRRKPIPNGATQTEDMTELTYDKTDGNWCFFAQSGEYTITQYMSGDKRIQAYIPANGWMALKVQIPRAGKYRMSLGVVTYNQNCATNGIYFFPTTAEDKIPSKLNSSTKVCSISPYKGENLANVEVEAGTIDAPSKGEYVVAFTQEAKSALPMRIAYISVERVGKADAETPPNTEDLTGNNWKLYVVSSDNAADAEITSNLPGFVKGNADEYGAGTEVTLTAAENSKDASFKYWKNITTGQVLTTDRTYTFVIGSRTNLMAVYEDKNPSQETVRVDFFNYNGSLLESKTANRGDLLSAYYPSDPVMPGYIFKNWSVGGETKLVSPIQAVAQYEKDSSFGISVTKPSGTEVCKFEDEVSVTSQNDDFVCWTRNGKVVSFDKTYSFYAWDDCEISEVRGASIEQTPRIVLADGKVGGARMVEYYLPSGYTKIEAGIIFSSSSNLSLNSSEEKAVSKNSGSHGQFSARSDKAYARGYLVYTNGSEIAVVYSDALSN